MTVLVLNEFIRHNHIKVDDNNIPRNIYAQTAMGKKLRAKLSEIGLKSGDFVLDYVYDLIPEPKKVDDRTGNVLTYKEPPMANRIEPHNRLSKRIIDMKPDIIIVTGNMGCKFFLGESSITRLRGRPEKITVTHPETEEQFETWILPMYSMEFITAKPNNEGLLNADLVTLERFLANGEQIFEHVTANYEFVTEISRVDAIFDLLNKNKPVTAWDLETNTLKPERKGAKALVISLSWEHGQGVTIPLEHKAFNKWTIEDVEHIYDRIREFVASDTIIKVGHNILYDIRFLMSTRGFTVFNNHRDTKIMYYCAVTQEVDDSLKLSDLSYILTEMGGYDKPLEVAKKKYIKDWNTKEKERVELLKKAEKDRVKLEFDEATKAYLLEKAKLKKEGKLTIHLTPPVKEKVPAITAMPLVNEIDGSGFNYEWFDLEDLHPYASGDTDSCRRIYFSLMKTIEKNPQMLFNITTFYPKLTVALARIESTGVAVNEEYMQVINEAYTEEEARLVEEMRKFPDVKELEEQHHLLYMEGVREMKVPKKDRDEATAKLRDKYKKKLEFNPNSATDKGKVLYDIMQIRLPFSKETIKEGAFDIGKPEHELTWEDFKTDKHALAYISENMPEHKPLTDLMLAHSKVKTLKNNFTKKLLNFISDIDFRVHGRFNPTGTETSRLSSSEPNMQQIPSKTADIFRFDYKHPIKRMFVTSFEGGAILQLDYSSLEMRILALAAGDEAMTQAFLEGADLHKETAAMVNKVPISEVTGTQRRNAKAVNFGIAYGESPFSFAPKHDMTVQEAEEIFNDYFKNKPKIKEFIDKVHKDVQKDGYVETLAGHKRMLKSAWSKDRKTLNEALRQSVNTIIQGTGAYLTNMALVYIDEFIQSRGLKSKLVMTVHDSIVLDCPKEEIELVASTCKAIMENLPVPFLTIDWKGGKLKYPIEADIEIGSNYNDMTEYDKEEFSTFNSVAGYVKYYKDMSKFSDYKDSGVITEEQEQQGILAVKSSYASYKNIA